MISESRTIARIIEFFHLPTQHSVEQLREVYQEISGSCGYDNFIRIAGGARLESAATEGGAVSRISFMKDRLSFQEEHSNVSLEGLRRRIEAVIGTVVEKLSIPVFIVRNVTLRAVASPPQTSSQFLAENLFQLRGEDLAGFGRPGQVIGFRMHFPPPEPRAGTHQVRVESYMRDPRMLYLEDVATFKVPVQSRDFKKIGSELEEVDSFLHDKVHDFLNQFPR